MRRPRARALSLAALGACLAACGGGELRLVEGSVALGNCSERCMRVASLDDDEVRVRVTGAYLDEGRLYADARGALSAEGRGRLDEELAALAGEVAALPEVSGCPGCADDPAASLTLEEDGRAYAFRFEMLSPPEPLAGLAAIVRELISSLGLCEDSPLVRYQSGERDCVL